MAKCNLGKVNLESMRPAVFLKNMHAGWPQGFALPCADESAVLAICYSFAIIAVLLQFEISYFILSISYSVHQGKVVLLTSHSGDPN